MEANTLTGSICALHHDVRVAVTGPAILAAVANLVSNAQGPVVVRVASLITDAESCCLGALDEASATVEAIRDRLTATTVIASAHQAARVWNEHRHGAIHALEHAACAVEAKEAMLLRTQATIRKYLGEDATKMTDFSLGRKLAATLRRAAVDLSTGTAAAPEVAALLHSTCDSVTGKISEARTKLERITEAGRTAANDALRSRTVDALTRMFDNAKDCGRLDIQFSLVDASKAILGGNGDAFKWMGVEWRVAVDGLKAKLAETICGSLAVSQFRSTCRAMGESIASSIATVSSLAVQAGKALEGAWASLAVHASTALKDLGHTVGSHLLGSAAMQGLAKGFSTYGRE